MDNGIGISREKLQQIKDQLHMQEEHPKAHIGLLNTNQRLILYYGAEYGLKISSHFGWGTRVSFEVPYGEDGILPPVQSSGADQTHE